MISQSPRDNSDASTRLVIDPAFRNLLEQFEPKFKLPGIQQVNSLLQECMEKAQTILKQNLALTRKITICLDIWTKKGMTASFL